MDMDPQFIRNRSSQDFFFNLFKDCNKNEARNFHSYCVKSFGKAFLKSIFDFRFVFQSNRRDFNKDFMRRKFSIFR